MKNTVRKKVINILKIALCGIALLIKYACLIVLLAATLLFTSRLRAGTPDYYCDVNEVESVSVVRLCEPVFDEGTCPIRESVLVEIDDIEGFVDRVNQLEQQRDLVLSDPISLRVDDIAIRIQYHNGDIDYLNWMAQTFVHEGEARDAFWGFDEEQFTQLLNDYGVLLDSNE